VEGEEGGGGRVYHKTCTTAVSQNG